MTVLRRPKHGYVLLFIGFELLVFLFGQLCLGFGSSSKSRPAAQSNKGLLTNKESRVVLSVQSGKDEYVENESNDFYNHVDGGGCNYKLSYRYKPPSAECKEESPWLLIHPVGIGLSNWFWSKLLVEEGPAMYAPNLIGCGLTSGVDPWDPDVKGMSFPLGWVQGCETLLQEITARQPRQSGGVVVIVQGGLAPVGILLASRNERAVKKLVLTSPPTYDFMTTPIPEPELERNYKFLRSKPWGSFAFDLLESRWAIKLFSNAFLFDKPCDDAWLDLAMTEVSKEARPPIEVFNAGFCNHRSLQEELSTIKQPTLVLSGAQDTKRHEDRMDYKLNMQNCIVQQLEKGKNVLPWECPTDFHRTVTSFCQQQE